jgi:hypothetical protein
MATSRQASELREGDAVKAPSARNWSKIKRIDRGVVTITVVLDWGTLVYYPKEKVWIKPT